VGAPLPPGGGRKNPRQAGLWGKPRTRREGNRLELLQYQNILNGYFAEPAVKL